MNEAKSRSENARAFKNCLEYLAREARECGLHELAELIEVAGLAAEDECDSAKTSKPNETHASAVEEITETVH